MPRGWLRFLLMWMGVASMLLASSCGTKPTRALAPELPLAELLTPCLRPPQATEGNLKVLLGNHIEAMLILDDCARKQAALALWAKEVAAPNEVRAWWEWR